MVLIGILGAELGMAGLRIGKRHPRAVESILILHPLDLQTHVRNLVTDPGDDAPGGGDPQSRRGGGGWIGGEVVARN